MEQARNQSFRGTGFNPWSNRSKKGSSSRKRTHDANYGPSISVPSTSDNPPQKKKLTMRFVESGVEQGATIHQRIETDYSDQAGIEFTKKANTAKALQDLQQANWQSFNWTDECVYSFFAFLKVGANQYLELVKEGGFQAFKELSKEITRFGEEGFSEEYQGQLYIIQVLAAIFAQQGHHEAQIPREAKKILEKYKNLTPNTWPDKIDINIDSKRKPFQQLLGDLLNCADFECILTRKLNNHYGTAHAVVDANISEQVERWQGTPISSKTELGNRISVNQLLSHFRGEDKQQAGAALFYLLTIDPNIYDEEFNVQEEQWLRQELANYFGKNWTTSLKGLQETVAYFCIGYLHINPLQYTHHSSESHTRPVTYTAGPSSSQGLDRADRIKNGINENYTDLIKRLPWDDAYFVADIAMCFHGNQKSMMKSKLTGASKGEYFVDHVLLPQVESGDLNCYDTFKIALQKYKSPATKKVLEKLERGEATSSSRIVLYTPLNQTPLTKILQQKCFEFVTTMRSDDPGFRAQLKKNSLLPGNTEAMLNRAMCTEADNNNFLLSTWERSAITIGEQTKQDLHHALKESADEFPEHGALAKFFEA